MIPKKIHNDLIDQKFIFLLGSSGVGKTSILKAGITPLLKPE